MLKLKTKDRYPIPLSEKESKKRYLKEHKKYIKELVKLAKKDGEFESCCIYLMLLKMIDGRLTYFVNGYNMHRTYEDWHKIVESLTEAKRLLEHAYKHEFDEDFYDNTDNKLWEEAFSFIGKHFRDWLD